MNRASHRIQDWKSRPRREQERRLSSRHVKPRMHAYIVIRFDSIIQSIQFIESVYDTFPTSHKGRLVVLRYSGKREGKKERMTVTNTKGQNAATQIKKGPRAYEEAQE